MSRTGQIVYTGLIMAEFDGSEISRYERQIAFDQLGVAGQHRLQAARVLIVGVGGLGSWAAELLARAGAGFLRLVDNDKVDTTNLHRQAMYDESDTANRKPKVLAAAEHIKQINSTVTVEPIVTRLDKDNIDALAADVDLILDGTDNFPTRFIINDYAVKFGKPWIFAGVVGSEAQTMTILPPSTPCLRCIYDSAPPPCMDPTCRSAGVLGPAVAAIASMQAFEAIKILTGQTDQISTYLTKLDFWANTFQRIDISQACTDVNCPCCKQKLFEFLEVLFTLDI